MLRQLFAVAEKITPLREFRFLAGADLRLGELSDPVAQALFQTLFFHLVHGEPFALANESAVGIIRLAIGRKCLIALAEGIQIVEMPPLVEKLTAVVLPVDIEQKRPQLTQLRRRDRHAVHTAGALAVR